MAEDDRACRRKRQPRGTNISTAQLEALPLDGLIEPTGS